MVIQLVFNPEKFPRTITRKEWQDIWRWKRCTESSIRAYMLIAEDALRTDTITARARAEIIKRIINPPIIIHSKQVIR